MCCCTLGFLFRPPVNQAANERANGKVCLCTLLSNFHSIQYSLEYGFGLAFAPNCHRHYCRCSGCHSFLPHSAVPFQKMLPPFTKVDLFLNIISTSTTFCIEIAAYFYLSRHFNHLRFSCSQRGQEDARERGSRRAKSTKIKMRKTIHLKWIAEMGNGNVMQLFFIHEQNGRRRERHVSRRDRIHNRCWLAFGTH